MFERSKYLRLSKKELKQQAKRFLNLRELFPESKPDLNALTVYQARKIRDALKTIYELAEGYHYAQKDFVPLKNATKYMRDKNLPVFSKGIFLAGGDRDNKDAIYQDEQIKYRRGDAERSYISLDSTTARRLKKDLNHALDILPSGAKCLTANGRSIKYPPTETDQREFMETQALFIFNKYKDMAERGEFRSNGRKAAHPKKWGIGVLYEASRLSAEEAWKKLSATEKAGWAQGAKYLKMTKKKAFIHVYTSK